MSKVTVTINGQDVEAEAGRQLIDVIKENVKEEVPHYCYHPGLSVAASCRLCAVEAGSKDADGNVKMFPKVMMSCQMKVTDNMVVNTHTDKSKQHRKEIMEFLLINHPLDCPVCDQAGECGLQDHSYNHGQSESRFREDKIKQPKKQVGEKVLLYGDRCIMCTRCVRFTREISGGGELYVHERGNGSEIDVFPGFGVNDKLAGNVVDLCPVGALLDNEFLFKQRVWELKSADSVCAGCSKGCNITVDYNKGVIYRLKPRHNPEVNDYWMCDEGRHGFKYVHADERIKRCQVRRDSAMYDSSIENAVDSAKEMFSEFTPETGRKLAVVISPMASLEEQWLAASWARELNEQAILVRGPVFNAENDETFKAGFTISKEKAPNRRGMELILETFGGDQMTFTDLVEAAGRNEIEGIFVQGGYPWQNWCPDEMVEKLRNAKVLIVSDILDSKLSQRADVVFASAVWAEKSGSFINDQNMCQPFEQGIETFEVGVNDLTVFWQLAGRVGPADLELVREELSEIKNQSCSKEQQADTVGA